MCAHDLPTWFRGLDDLTRLPWFKKEDGRIKIKHPTPVIDFHTHLSLAYLRKNRADLHKLHDETLNYLPREREFSVENYINKNFTKEDLSALKKDLVIGGILSPAGGMRVTHTAANLKRDMDDLGIRHSVLLPIDFPFVSDNAGTWLEAVAGDPRFICYGSVHPFSTKKADRLDRQHGLGATGVKVHPNIQAVAPEGKRSMDLYDLCDERKMTVFWHCGPVGIEPPHGKILTQVRRYEKPIREFRRTTFVLGHAGALQNEEALQLASKNENVWLEISGQSVERIQEMIARGPVDRIVFGTDWPWYHQAIGLAKVYMATEGRDDIRQKILYDNAAQLLGLPNA